MRLVLDTNVLIADEILATAKTAGCLAIVTGDKDLTILGHYGQIKILAPSDYWKFEEESSAS